MEWISFVDVPVHPRGSQFPIIRDGITSSASLLIALGFLIHYILPLWMRKREPIELRPFMLIWSGVLFAISGCGFMICMVLTNMGQATMSCQREPDDLKDAITAHCGYLYFLVKFLDFGRAIFAVLRKKKSQSGLLNTLHLSLLLLLIHSGIYFHSGGVGFFIGAVETFLGTFINAYYILTTAKVFKNAAAWKGRLIRLQVIAYAALVAHALYFMAQPRCSGPTLYLCFQAFFGASSCLFFAHKYPENLLSFKKGKKML